MPSGQVIGYVLLHEVTHGIISHDNGGPSRGRKALEALNGSRRVNQRSSASGPVCRALHTLTTPTEGTFFDVREARRCLEVDDIPRPRGGCKTKCRKPAGLESRSVFRNTTGGREIR
ncbi:hypothetical protein EVAR_88000_1 [Eumeta japonica]|uniref:Uncharacterized protein n=1 Tax=Eumeta variegata TaxID=151549 RepID=A0A4C1VC41_EUMVA|nr:hypothetical protein EVAR_88000_1 [Eumeta japonica]